MEFLLAKVTVTKKSECCGLVVNLLIKRFNADMGEPRRTKILRASDSAALGSLRYVNCNVIQQHEKAYKISR